MAFVGRERELAQLAEAIARVADGRRTRVFLTGPAGIGCTRLLDELEARMRGVAGVVIARGRADEPASGIAFAAVGEALATALSSLADADLRRVAGTAAHDLAAVVPGLAGRLDAARIDRGEPSLRAPEQVGRRVVEGIVGCLERLAGDGVVLLVIEDAHFADPATREFIEILIGLQRPRRICLAVTYQPDEVHRRHPARQLVARLADETDAVRIALGPLDGADIARVVQRDDEDRLQDTVLSAIRAGARGSPLVALHLAAAARDVEGVRLADSFEDLCGARLEALPRDASRVVRLLAAARRPLARGDLLGGEAPGGRVTSTAIDSAIGSGLVQDVGGRLAIAHQLVAEAIEAYELPPERQTLHVALAARPACHPAEAAWHWTLAGRLRDARAAHVAAARAAIGIDPAGTALYHHERALELPTTDRETGTQEADLLAGAARASAASGEDRRAVALMRRAISARATREGTQARGRREAADRLVLGAMHEELGRFQSSGSDTEEARGSFERALAILPPGPSLERARAQASLAQLLMLEGDFAASAALASEVHETLHAVALSTGLAAATIAEEPDAHAIRGHATCTLGVDAAYLGRLDEGLALLEDATAIARDAGRLDDLMRAAANRTLLLDMDARREAALEVVEASLADAAAGGLAATYRAMLGGNAADILFQLGRWAEAEASCRAALEWRPRRPGAAWFWPLVVLGLVLTESHADEEAASLVGQTLLQLETVQPGQWSGLVLRSAISHAIWHGDPEAALAIAEEGWPRLLETDEAALIAQVAATCLEAAAAAAEQGRVGNDAGIVARARALADLIIPEAQARVAGGTLDTSVGARREADLWIATAKAHRARVRGRPDPARWEQVASAWHERAMPFVEAKTRLWQTLAILETTADLDRDTVRAMAREPLLLAYRIALELPALPLLRAIVDLATRARIALPAKDPAVVPISAGRDLVAVGPGYFRLPVVGRRDMPDRVSLPSGRPRTDVRSTGGVVGSSTFEGASPAIERDYAYEGPARGGDHGLTDPVARSIHELVIASIDQSSSDPYGLSPREREVLNILAEGRTDRDIASRLFISERTVHVHVRRILAKLGVGGRTEAAGLAIRQGWSRRWRRRASVAGERMT